MIMWMLSMAVVECCEVAGSYVYGKHCSIAVKSSSAGDGSSWAVKAPHSLNLAGTAATSIYLAHRHLQVLSAAEEREQKLIAADEALTRRRKELEREHAGRMAEAEAAVRRLQV